MCAGIRLKGIDILSVKDYKEYFKQDPVCDPSYKNIIDNYCLCQIDIEKSLDKLGLKYEYDAGEYWVKED
jgi:hypothetical protein